MITCAIDPNTNEFLESGDTPTSMRVALPRNPDPLREKYSGNPADPFTAKSGAETAATVAARTDAAAGAVIDTQKALMAVALSGLARALSKSPAALTPAEIAAERARIVAIYKAL